MAAKGRRSSFFWEHGPENVDHVPGVTSHPCFYRQYLLVSLSYKGQRRVKKSSRDFGGFWELESSEQG